MKFIKGKIKHWLDSWALKRINQLGLQVVRMEEIAGTCYIVAKNGIRLRVGGKGK